MELLEKKNIKGKTYYYYSSFKKVDGKCKRIWQKYLGRPDNILKAFENNEPPNPQYAEIFQQGLTEVLFHLVFSCRYNNPCQLTVSKA